MMTFDAWWEIAGSSIDPDTEDVPWFDKRKAIAEAAWGAATAVSGNYTADYELYPQADTAARKTAKTISDFVLKFPGLGEDVFVHEHDYNQAMNRIAALEAEKAVIVGQRDEAYEAISEIYFRIIGSSPEWSNLFGVEHAIAEIVGAFDMVRAHAKEKAAAVLAEREAFAKLCDEFDWNEDESLLSAAIRARAAADKEPK